MTYLSSFRASARERFHRAHRQSEKHHIHLSISVQNCYPALWPTGCQAAALPAPMAVCSRKPEQQATGIVFLRTLSFLSSLLPLYISHIAPVFIQIWFFPLAANMASRTLGCTMHGIASWSREGIIPLCTGGASIQVLHAVLGATV